MFEKWYLDELIGDTIKNVWKLTDHYLLKLIDNIIEQTGMVKDLANGSDIKSIIKNRGFAEKVFSSIEWLLNRLEMDGYIKKSNDAIPVYKLTDKKNTGNLDQIKAQAEKQAPTSIAAFNMLQLMADNYPDYLYGKKTGVDIIFSAENIHIINEYYSNNLFYNVHNIAGAKILNWDIESRKNPVILEIGGGMGGGTKQFVSQRIADKKSMDGFKYYFTDIANKMLRSTKKELSLLTDNLSSFEFTKCDFNSDLANQEYKDLDVIWGVNAAHVAVDLRYTLNEFHKALKPGGALIISETVRPIGNRMIQQEFLLNTLDDYWNVKLDPPIRPKHGFMDWRDWVEALKAIGFSDVKTVPDMAELEKQYDNCYVAVIRAVK